MILSYQYLSLRLPRGILLWLKRRMRWVQASGGMVSDDGGHLLLIYRNGRWDLPKGKVEAGESLAEAALRETAEETGVEARLSAEGMHALIGKTYHVFNLYGGWHLKQTSWFFMHTDGIEPPTRPQGEEGISKACWVEEAEALRLLSRSYGTLRLLSREARKKREDRWPR